MLGAKPKARGRGGPSRGKGDIWSNPTRRSARSLKGRGQAVAAAREYPPVREQKENVVVAVRVSGAGPRVYRGPGCDSHKAKKKTGSSGVIMFDSLRDSLLAALLGMSLFALFVYDLLILERSDECGKVTGLTRTQLACTVTGAFTWVLFLCWRCLQVFYHLGIGKNLSKKMNSGEMYVFVVGHGVSVFLCRWISYAGRVQAVAVPLLRGSCARVWPSYSKKALGVFFWIIFGFLGLMREGPSQVYKRL